jgi:hypothetical protein
VAGGRCIVAWSKITRPRDLGGLGVLDLATMGYALRLRWAWLSRVEPECISSSLASKPEAIVQAMFHASVTVRDGTGCNTLFWSDRWLDGTDIPQLAPELVQAVARKARKTRTVVQAFQNDAWIRDISGSLSVAALAQYIQLWIKLSDVHLDASQQDKFVLRWTTHQQHSASSAYRAFFHGQCGIPGATVLCKMKAPPSCKFFIWLSLMGRCWTSERLQRHGLPDNGPCALCSQDSELIQHLLVACVFSREVWHRMFRNEHLQAIVPSASSSWPDWWLQAKEKGGGKWSQSLRNFGGFVQLVTVEGTERAYFRGPFQASPGAGRADRPDQGALELGGFLIVDQLGRVFSYIG